MNWYLNGIEQESLRDQFEILAAKGSGSWTVKVTFVTREVRSDPTGLLTDPRAVTV